MSLKHYNLQLDVPDDIEVGKTYYKNPLLTHVFAELPKITILSHSGGIVTATIGDDTFIQTLTENETHAYINHQGGYHHTA